MGRWGMQTCMTWMGSAAVFFTTRSDTVGEYTLCVFFFFFFFHAEDGIRGRSPSRGLGEVYRRQLLEDVMNRQALDNLSLVGSVMIFCVGVNLVWGKKFRVAKMLPGLVLAVVCAFLPWF